MIDLDKTFNDHYMRQRRYLAWRGPAVARAIVDGCALRDGASVVDLGCGVGDIVAALLDLGMDAWGVEGSREGKQHHILAEERYLYMDLRGACSVERKFDLALCFELAPFIEPEFVATFHENLARFSNRLLLGRIDDMPGYAEVPAVAEAVRDGLRGLCRQQAVKAIFNSARYFVRKETHD